MKQIILNAIFISLVLVFLSISGIAQKSETGSVILPPFEAGQRWSYKTRANESNSTFVILKVDADPKLGKIIHIAVMDLKMKNRRSPDGVSEKIGHMPFSEKAIAQSVVKLLKEKADRPDFESGYDMWKEAFDQKRAGFYTVSLAEAIKITEEGLNL